MIKSGRLTVTTTPQSLIYPEAIDSLRGQTVCIKNTDATNAIYLGGSDVTTANGYVVSPGSQLSIELETIQDLYVVADTEVVASVLWVDVN